MSPQAFPNRLCNESRSIEMHRAYDAWIIEEDLAEELAMQAYRDNKAMQEEPWPIWTTSHAKAAANASPYSCPF